jgi:Tfp pilus assembly major pilin PilA
VVIVVVGIVGAIVALVFKKVIAKINQVAQSSEVNNPNEISSNKLNLNSTPIHQTSNEPINYFS